MYLDGRIRIRVNRSRFTRIVEVNDAQHGRDQSDGENVISIREETNTRHHHRTNMIPPKGRLVDLRKSQSPPLVGVGDVSIIVVEVVEGRIASGRLHGHGEKGRSGGTLARTKEREEGTIPQRSSDRSHLNDEKEKKTPKLRKTRASEMQDSNVRDSGGKKKKRKKERK